MLVISIGTNLNPELFGNVGLVFLITLIVSFAIEKIVLRKIELFRERRIR
jgi:hypothetical protein